jgi:hypothetical protein
MAEEKEFSISWQAPEFYYYEKTSDWYWVLGIICIGIVVASILLKNFLFAVLVFFAGFSIALYGAKRPRMINFSINERGVVVDNKQVYPYENIKSFWIEYNPPFQQELLIELKKSMTPKIAIILNDVDPEEIKKYLLKHIKEEKISESLPVIISRILKF